MSNLVLLAVVISTLSVGISATQSSRNGLRANVPQGDQRAAPEVGTGHIGGVVFSLDDGRALRGARVQLATQGGLGARETRSDAQGRFAFDQLASGAYELTGAKGGYVFRRFGQKGALDSGQIIRLEPGQLVDGANLLLPRARAIVGRITDEYGDPVADVTVQGLKERFVDGVRQMVPIPRTARTDDLGGYRLFGLEPGTYFVTATSPRTTTGGGPFAGLQGMGGRAGGMAAAFASEPQAPAADTIAYTPAYYPGTPSVSDAAPVIVSDGQDTVDISFSLALGRSTSVSGTVVTSTGAPLAQGMVSIYPASETALPRMNRASVNGGAFVLQNVPPGSYVLQANVGPSVGRNDLGRESGRLEITVDSTPLSGVIVTTSRGAILRGRVVLEGATGQESMKGMQVAAVSTVQQGGGPGVGAPVSPEAIFELRGVRDKSVFRVIDAPPGWSLKKVTLRGVDVTDTPVELGTNGQLDGLEVRLSNQQPRLHVTVSGRARRTGDPLIVVFSTDASRWNGRSRFVKTARADEAGKSEIEGLPPDRYFVATVEGVEQATATAPGFLDALKSQAVVVTLREGETQQLQLTRRASQ